MLEELRIVKLGWSDTPPDNAFILTTFEEGREKRVWAVWQRLVPANGAPGMCWVDVPIADEQRLFRRYDIQSRFSGLPFVAKIPPNLTGDSGPAAIHHESEAAARQFDNEYPNSPVDKFYMGYRTAARKYKSDARVAGVYASQIQTAQKILADARELADNLKSRVRVNKWIKRRLKTLVGKMDELRGSIE